MPPGFVAAQMWVRNLSGDQGWQDHAATLDEDTLRHLSALLKAEARTVAKRCHFVDMMLGLLPVHECDCDRRWTQRDDVPHATTCDRLKACTCERRSRTLGAPDSFGLYVSDHAVDCAIRNWEMIPARMPDNYDDHELIVP